MKLRFFFTSSIQNLPFEKIQKVFYERLTFRRIFQIILSFSNLKQYLSYDLKFKKDELKLQDFFKYEILQNLCYRFFKT